MKKLQTKRKLLRYKLINKLSPIKPLFTKEEFIDNTFDYEWQCRKCDTVFFDTFKNGMQPRCPNCSPKRQGISSVEKDLCRWIKKNIPYEVIENKRFYSKNNKSKSFEIDIYIPELKIGVELDGVYWHCEVSGDKDPDYHFNKTNFFERRGIQIIHITDSEWNNKKQLCKSLLLCKFGMIQKKIPARKCIIQTIDNKKAKIFYDNTHLSGGINCIINIGLVYRGKIVMCMSFNQHSEGYELVRFSTRNFAIVQGGFSRLFSYFCKTYSPKLVITKVNRKYNIGNIYTHYKWFKKEILKPDYMYTKNHVLLENKDIGDWSDLKEKGYDRLWDAGYTLFELVL